MTDLFMWVLRVSVQASVLTLLVLAARALVARRPGFCLGLLYALIALRLALPISFQSPLSVQNLWQTPPAQTLTAQAGHTNDSIGFAVNEHAFSAPQTDTILAPGTQVSQSENAASTSVVSSAAPKAQPLSWPDIGAAVWISGMAVFSGVMLTGNALFKRRLARNREYDEPGFAALLADCRQALGIKRRVLAIRTSETGTAAAYGVLQPVLLISPQAFAPLTQAQKRHVLMHELSHIRRHDTQVCAVATVLNIVHWFNPLIWVVFALMRRDIELLCDAHVFRILPNAHRFDYAQTLLRLAGPVQTPKLVPALFISKANVKKRIVMIMTHKKRSVVFSAAALLLTLMVAVTGCTTAIEDTQTTPDAPVPTAAAMPVAAMPEQTPAAASPEPTPAQNDAEKTLMATFTIDNSNHNATNRMYNVRKAADMLSGAVIKPGETISLNEILGPRTVSDGWKEAAGISNGAYISEPGGGVCAVSSALYNAAIRAELTIVEMRHHSLVPFYVDIGLDACISNGGPDLKIQNPYDSDVTIEAVLDDMLLTVNIYGPPLGYTVDYRSEEKETGQTPETKYIYNTEITPEGIYIAPGIAMEYLHARPFTSYEVYKTRYDLEGKEIDTTLFQKSSYRAIQGIVYVNGPDPNSESTPPPVSDPSS